MAIEKGTYYKLVCDRCGDWQGFEGELGGYDLYESREEAVKSLDYYAAELRDGKVFCEPCRDSLAPAGEEGTSNE